MKNIGFYTALGAGISSVIFVGYDLIGLTPDSSFNLLNTIKFLIVSCFVGKSICTILDVYV